jgi:hypothetical protein
MCTYYTLLLAVLQVKSTNVDMDTCSLWWYSTVLGFILWGFMVIRWFSSGSANSEGGKFLDNNQKK